jgi:hypothetical protein
MVTLKHHGRFFSDSTMAKVFCFTANHAKKTVRGSPIISCVQTGAASEGQSVEQCNILILGISENSLL